MENKIYSKNYTLVFIQINSWDKLIIETKKIVTKKIVWLSCPLNFSFQSHVTPVTNPPNLYLSHFSLTLFIYLFRKLFTIHYFVKKIEKLEKLNKKLLKNQTNRQRLMANDPLLFALLTFFTYKFSWIILRINTQVTA